MRITRQIRSGCGSSRIRHGSPGSVPVTRASSTIRARCWNATAMPRSPAHLDLRPGRPGHQQLAGGQRADGLGQHLI